MSPFPGWVSNILTSMNECFCLQTFLFLYTLINKHQEQSVTTKKDSRQDEDFVRKKEIVHVSAEWMSLYGQRNPIKGFDWRAGDWRACSARRVCECACARPPRDLDDKRSHFCYFNWPLQDRFHFRSHRKCTYRLTPSIANINPIRLCFAVRYS